ncbi:DUF6603 domain-containing protein [Streptomyces lydicus]|uniref:DUF6603 domain-containing protein n=1 Tax=Streptomyces lydicus TaxID=47763 RepID=UPI001012DCD5|nr:DUF6603 domain-containing protein [Streptomyces lydicus]MCZ1006773.1 hypothetical protein [Streptomyces lydicus]
MALTVDRLRTVLAQAQDDTYLELLPDFLDLEPALELFKQYVQDEILDIRGVTVDVQALSVTGTAVLVGQAASPVAVWFLPDEAGQQVVGFRVDAVLLSEGPGLPDALAAARDVLNRLRLGPAHLVFGVEPGERHEPQPRVGFGVEVLFPTEEALPRPYAWGYPPLWPGQSWCVASVFADVPFPSLDELLVFAGLPPSGFDIPGDVLRDCALALQGLAITFFSGRQVQQSGRGVESDWLALWLKVGLDQPWTPLPGIITVDELNAEFSLADPFESPRLTTVLAGRVTLAAEIVVDVGITLPERSLSGRLARPVPVGAMLQQRFPGIPLPADLTVTELGLWGELATGDAQGYGIDLTLANVWHFAEGIDLSDIVLTFSDTGGTKSAGLSAVWRLVNGALDVTGTWEQGTGWAFLANAENLQPARVMAALGITPPDVLDDLVIEQLTVAFDSSGHFAFDCAATVQLGDLDAALQLTVTADRSTGETGVGGLLQLAVPLADGDIRVLDFTVQYASGAGGQVFTGTWSGTPGISADELAGALGLDLPGLPEILRPELQALSVRYDTATGEVLLTASTERTGWVYVSRPGTGPGAPRFSAAAVRARLGARASDLPLVGEAIPPGADLVIDGIAFTSTPTGWTAAQAGAVNDALDRIDSSGERRLPRFAVGTTAGPGIAVQIELSIGGVPQDPLLLPITTGPGGTLVATLRGPITVHAASDDTWSRDLDLTLGAVRISRIGIGLADGQIFVALDAVLSVGPVRLVLMGLGLGIDGELSVSPRLRGAGVQLDKPPLKISGMVERRSGSEVAPGLKEQFIGLATIETGFFALYAAGSYAKAVDDWSSMFLFGEISGGERGLFGPPPFRVIAISLGFGVNSTVRTPTIDEVGRFPLVNRLDGSGTGDTPEQVLEKLAGPGGWITPREGQYWGAGGIEFSSFEFIRSRALLLVEGGQSWKVLLIGRTTIDLPRSKAAKKPIARLVIDLAIGYHHDKGLFSMDAVVAPGSYVIDPAAELTGGLSFYIWGQDRTAQGGGKGFVFTLGGYHKRFKRPAYYPNPPRVGWRWAIGPVAIRGQVYAALTDGAFMAGGELSANYDKGHGIQLQAWFTAWLDALVQWKPFYFDLSMGLSIGVAATVKVLFIRVRVSLSVGVSLDLWGPPIGGRAKIKVWFISFTVEFGTGRDGVPAVEWGEFSVQLPAPLSIAPLSGLLVDVDPEETTARSDAGEPLLVSMDGFAVRTEAAVPASHIIFNDQPFAEAEDDTIDIRPMGTKGQGVVSEHHVTLQWFDSVYTPTGWGVAVYRQDMPKAMWGAPLDSPSDVLDGDGLLSGCLAGITFEVPKPELAPSVGWVDAEALESDGLPDAPIPLLGSQPEGPPSVPDDEGEGSIGTIVDPDTGIGAQTTADNRAAVHAALAGLGLAPGTDDLLTRYADLAKTTFTNAPMTTTAER